uniref:G-protein coupled receptors family 1 profile domain-containing protein n=1 Tax=Panagrellus redivivus TaxID=6233 RepID=A0A7E4VZB6_PANRE
MRLFCTILIQTCIIDILNAILTTTMNLQFDVTDGYIFMTTGNDWLNLPQPWQCSYLVLAAVVCNVSFWSLPIQAIYRYLTVVRDVKVKVYFPMLLYLTTFVFAMAAGARYYLDFEPIKGTFMQPLINKMPFWVNHDTNKFCAAKLLAFGPLFFCGYLVVSQLFGFVVMVWTTVRFHKTLNSTSNHAKSLKMHNQITRQLYAQTVFPGLIAVLLFGMFAVAFTTSNYSGGLFMYLVLPYPWVNVINPLLTLFCIHQYRRVVTSMFCRRSIQVSNIASTSSLTKSKQYQQQKVTTVESVQQL